MAVRMGLVEVTYQQILRVGNTHFLHIFFGDLRHQRIGHVRSFFRRKREGDMPDRVFQPRVQSGLILKILDYVLYLRRVYAFGIEDARQFLHHIADSPGKG